MQAIPERTVSLILHYGLHLRAITEHYYVYSDDNYTWAVGRKALDKYAAKPYYAGYQAFCNQVQAVGDKDILQELVDTNPKIPYICIPGKGIRVYSAALDTARKLGLGYANTVDERPESRS